MFSMMITASSITKPTAIVSAISEILSRLKPRKYIATSVAAIDTGMVMLGMKVVQNRRRNSASTMHDKHDGDRHRELDIGDRGADQQRAVIDHVDIDRRRYPALELRQRLEDFVDGLDDIGVGFFQDVEDDGGLAVEPAGAVFVDGAVGDVRDVAQLDGGPLCWFEDDVLKVGGFVKLIVGDDAGSNGSRPKSRLWEGRPWRVRHGTRAPSRATSSCLRARAD